jgi:hypothetical protein
VEVPSVCPLCGEAFVWEIDLATPRELAWRAPFAPGFLFACAACGAAVRVTFEWRLEAGSDPRPLRLVPPASRPDPERPRLLLVDACPHGCATLLGFELDPADPALASDRFWPDEARTLGGYRCPRCDGEGLLVLRPLVEPA